MSFYQSISDHYSKIFPLNPGQIRFVNKTFPEAGELSLLDIGCGTGDLSMELSKLFNRVVGIDLDEAMLAHAQKGSEKDGNIQFYNLNMMDILQKFGPEAFDAILCFGNTLVHLQSMEEISSFLRQCAAVIRSNGKLLLQLINYDRILDLNINSLPTLETEEVKFVRNYNYLEVEQMIEFETILTIKATNQVIRNIIHLNPIRKVELKSMLQLAGFRTIRFYGNFKGDPLSAESVPMVIEAIS